MTVSAVAPADAVAVLSEVEPQFLEAMASGQGDAHTVREFVESIRDGKQSLWAIHENDAVEAVLALSVTQHATGRKVFVNLLAGEGMLRWGDEVEDTLKKCRDLSDAMCIEASCRPVLSRYLKRRGWKVKAVIMEAPE